MFFCRPVRLYLAALISAAVVGCSHPAAVIAPPAPPPTTPTAVVLPSPTPASTPVAILAGPEPRPLSPKGYDLIIEFEVGGISGYNPHPEAPDARYSGVTWGVGYDAHQNSKPRIKDDWKELDPPKPDRLAETQPYYGRSAQQHLQDVRDILVKWSIANNVFLRIDVAREFASCRHAYSGFDALRPNAQAALISLTFNRGTSTAGPTRTEMRNLVGLVPKADYAGMAAQFRAMKRVWRGTSIERGMTRRREAEAKLIETL